MCTNVNAIKSMPQYRDSHFKGNPLKNIHTQIEDTYVSKFAGRMLAEQMWSDSEEGDERYAITPFYIPSSNPRPWSNANDNRIVSSCKQEVV